MRGDEIRFVVPAVPVAQPRQRHAIVAGRVRNYTPSSHPVQAYKAAVMLAAKQAGVRTPLDEPVAVEIDFYLPRPKRLMRRKDPDGPVPHTSKPDVDNLFKSTVDALTGLAWRDDTLIYETTARKWYCEKDGAPRVEITIRAVREGVA